MKTKIALPAFALAALLFLGLPLASSSAYVAVSIGIAPPPIPIYQQPLCPAPGYIWTPGYWAYGDYGYYWAPGVWVAPPSVGLLWTPGYWGYGGGTYVFHQGYWGPSVGFYGGINYGYGYYGSGYYGGEWVGSTFRYNTAVSRVNTNLIHNTYVNRQIVGNAKGSRAGFNGPGGVQAAPNEKELAAEKADHVPPTSAQQSRLEGAKNDPALRARNDKEAPKAAAVKTFESKHRPEVAGTAAAAKSERATAKSGAAGRTRAEKEANASRQTPAERADQRATSKTVAHSRSSARTAQSKEVAASHAHRRTTEAWHHESHQAMSATHAVHHAPTATHRTQVATHRSQAVAHRSQVTRTRPVTSAHERSSTAQNGRKGKKKHGSNG